MGTVKVSMKIKRFSGEDKQNSSLRSESKVAIWIIYLDIPKNVPVFSRTTILRFKILTLFLNI